MAASKAAGERWPRAEWRRRWLYQPTIQVNRPTRAASRLRNERRLTYSVFSVAITLSQAALSSAEPRLPMLETRPVSARVRPSSTDVYWVDSTGRRNTLVLEVGVGRQSGWMTTLTGRPAMRSPGRPPIRRDVERAFWVKVAEGLSSEEAAVACGVSGPAGSRWFRDRGGMPSIQLNPSSGRYLSFAEREEIALLRAQDVGVREIGRRLRRAPSTISRELRRNAATRGGRLAYRAGIAQWKAELMLRRPKTAKLAADDRLRGYVQERLAGAIRVADGRPVSGPATPRWNGRNKPRRQDRRWASAWSPEQIARRLPVDFPDDHSMRISHEAVYQALYVQGRGALRRDLVACLRTGRALRVPRSRARQRATGHVSSEVMISRRPAEVADRAVPGHWEGDLIIGTGRSAIGTLVERTTRFTMLLHLPRMA